MTDEEKQQETEKRNEMGRRLGKFYQKQSNTDKENTPKKPETQEEIDAHNEAEKKKAEAEMNKKMEREEMARQIKEAVNRSKNH